MKGLITITLILIALTVTAAQAKSISSLTKARPIAHEEVDSNYQDYEIFYIGSLADPKAIIMDLKEGLEFNTKNLWKRLTQEKKCFEK